MSHEDGDEEALSLCDLPINKPNQNEKVRVIGAQDEFDFGSSAGLASQMCAADEVFFRGQILPFRHSVSSDNLLNPSRCISRSESMDHIINSRSSSVKSQYSSSSGSSTNTTGTGYKPRIRNQFHSHPSPSPQIRSRSVRISNTSHRNSKSAVWSFFQTGLVRTPPEIRLPSSIWGKNNINKSFGSRNSNSSGSSTERKKKQRLFDINGALFGGCKCSVVNVVDIVPSEMVIVNGEEREKEMRREKEGKQAVSRNRTFEWLKQLSLEDGA